MGWIEDIKVFFDNILKSNLEKQNKEIGLMIENILIKNSNGIKDYVREISDLNENAICAIRNHIYEIRNNQLMILQKISELEQNIEKNANISNPPITQSIKNEALSKPSVTKYYSKMVDSNSPLGFKIENTTVETAESDSIFVITLSNEDCGTYEIIDNVDIRRDVLQIINPIISDSSDFEVLTNDNPSEIEIIEKGTVKKEGDLFKIITKQKIRIL